MTQQESLNEKLNLYEAMFERNPRDGLVSVAKTYLYILLDRPQDALKSALEASLSTSSKSLRVQLTIALGYYLRNKPGEALIESRYALNIDPASPLCYVVHASTLNALHRTDEARLAFLKCCSLATDNTFLADLKLRNHKAVCAAQAQNPLLMAYSNLKLRTPDMTETDVQALAEQYPTDPVIRTLLASLERRNGKIREALALLETSLAQYDAFPERLYLLWKIYDEQLGNHQKGETFARRLLEVDPLNDRATNLIYSSLDEETLRHVIFVRDMENLPDSIFARILPIHDLEGLIGTTEADTAVNYQTPDPRSEEQIVQREASFTLPETGHTVSAPPAVPEPATLPESEPPEPPPQPVMDHMASMLEQAQLIARDLRPTQPPTPMAQLHTAPAEPQAEASAEPEVDEVLQASPPPEQTVPEEPVAEPPPAVDIPSAAPPEQKQPAPQTTLHEANRLLADSKFEEALQAFLILSQKQ